MVNQLLTESLKEIENLKSGEVFLVRDLFKGYEWNRIPINVRLRLGFLFFNEITKPEHSDKIVPTEKTSSKQQKYKKL